MPAPDLSRPAGPSPRFRALALDGAVILGWVGFAGAVGLGLRAAGVSLEAPWIRDTVAFLTLVLPATVTFALQEASAGHATFGKRRTGLSVVDRHGHQISLRRSLIRSGVKFLPWQMAHTAVFGLLAHPDSSGLIALSIAAQALVLGSGLAMTLDPERRSLHDWLAGTRVTETTAPPST